MIIAGPEENRPAAGDEGAYVGRVIPGSTVPGDEDETTPPEQDRGPGVARTACVHYGPYLTPVFWIGLAWLTATAAWHTHAVIGRLILIAIPVVVTGLMVRHATGILAFPARGRDKTPVIRTPADRRARRLASGSWIAGTAWTLLAGALAGPGYTLNGLLFIIGGLLAATRAHEVRARRRDGDIPLAPRREAPRPAADPGPSPHATDEGLLEAMNLAPEPAGDETASGPGWSGPEAGSGPLPVPEPEPTPDPEPAPEPAYTAPPAEMFARAVPRAPVAADRDPIRAALIEVLEEHGVDATVTGSTHGPTISRYEITPGYGVKPEKITGLSKAFVLAVRTPDVRIILPVPGTSAIGVEIPRRDKETVLLGDVLRAIDALPAGAKHPLLAGLGKNVQGETVFVNLAKMPHLLIAGATGAGKSVCVNGLITSVLARATPEQVRMLLIDPKRVELSLYKGVPHLISPVITRAHKAAAALQWVVAETESRYDRLEETGFKHIDPYNEAVRAGRLRGLASNGRPFETYPYLLTIIDELADLMAVASADVEASIARITQIARAAGVHMVLATQRPSVDVVTGLIKSNVPARLAFATSSMVDSRVVIDQPGAEKLIGQGDALFKSGGASAPVRLQNAFVSEREIRAVVTHCKSQASPEYRQSLLLATDPDAGDPVITVPAGDPNLDAGPGLALPVSPYPAPPAEPLSYPAAATSEDMGEDPDEERQLLISAAELIVSTQFGSVSMLQRKLRIGFPRAGRLMDRLQSFGVVGEQQQGSQPRDVLVQPDDLEQLISDLEDA
jgi:DNA segregation ATPase FtsK/SpoIIIE, S-DNA-T family